MKKRSDVDEAVSSLLLSNGRTLAFREHPALTQTAHDAVEDHGTGKMIVRMLGAMIASILAAAGVFFLAVSPYLIAALAPLFQA